MAFLEFELVRWWLGICLLPKELIFDRHQCIFIINYFNFQLLLLRDERKISPGDISTYTSTAVVDGAVSLRGTHESKHPRADVAACETFACT